MALEITRGIDAQSVIASESEALIVVPLVWFDYPEAPRFFTNANIDIVLPNSTIMPAGTYVGVGGLASVGVVEEAADFIAPKLDLTLNGLDPTTLALVLEAVETPPGSGLFKTYYGAGVLLGLAILDSDYTVIGEPTLLFKGFAGTMGISMEADTASINLTAESIFSDWERPRVKRYNSVSQSDIDPNDLGFNNVAQLVSKELIWEG